MRACIGEKLGKGMLQWVRDFWVMTCTHTHTITKTTQATHAHGYTRVIVLACPWDGQESKGTYQQVLYTHTRDKRRSYNT